MTAKQLLHEYVDGLSEEDAIAAASALTHSGRRLSEAEKRAIEQGLREAELGLLIPLEDMEEDFGPD